jgi:hypothetical protein
MRKFRIKGASRETAEDVVLFINANNKDEATRKANASGVLVSEIKEIEVEEPKVLKTTSNPALGRYINKRRRNETASDKINRKLAFAVADLNVVLFVLICLSGLFAGCKLIYESWGINNYLVAMGIVTPIIAFLIGIQICGFTAIICSIHRDVKHLRDSTP